MWNGDNDPQEYIVDDVRASELEPIDASELGWGEVDGAVSINGLAVAKRLNDLLVIVQRLESRLEGHLDMVED